MSYRTFGVVVAGLLVVTLRAVEAQDVVSSWYPIHVGDHWTYEHETRDGSQGGGIINPEITRWRTEETIVSSVATPDGVLLVKHVQALNPNSGVEERHYLVHQDCVYALDERLLLASEQAGRPLQALDQNGQLTQAFRSELTSGDFPADFCFPLETGKRWGKLSEEMRSVVGIDNDAPIPSDARGQTFHLSAHPGSGETDDIWFAKGVGVIREQWVHHGTYEETRLDLIRFDPWWSR
jgi:hypothetical protein